MCKQICEKYCALSDAGNMGMYRTAITSRFPSLTSMEVVLPSEDVPVAPWQEWALGQSPKWWKDHTDVKHQRHVKFQAANLQNVLLALSGLMLVTLYLYHDDAITGMVSGEPRLLSINQMPRIFLPNENCWELK